MTDPTRRDPWWSRFPASRAGWRTAVAFTAASLAALALFTALAVTGAAHRPGRHPSGAGLAFDAAMATISVISGACYLASTRRTRR